MDLLQPQSINCIQYCVISAVCTFSLVYFIIVTDRSAEHSSELLFYKLAMGFSALCALTDILYAMREIGGIPLSNILNYSGEILYSISSICGAYCWFAYSEKKQQSRVSRSAALMKLLAVPFVLMCLFTVTTPLHGMCFSLSGQQYVRGVLNVPFTVICTAFFVYSGVSAFINSFRKINHSKTVLLRMLFMYSVFLTAAQILQVLAGPVMPFRSLTAAVIFMFITLRGMCETVTVDALSGINNRFSFNRLMDDKIAGGEKFWLMMLDIDDFKRINDTYGHIYGDEAIRYTAAAIARAVPAGWFVARFGGDEFSVVAPSGDESMIASLEDRIRVELQKIVKENAIPFDINITAGYAERMENIHNTPDMIEAADSVLYEKKRRKKIKKIEKG